MKTLERHKYTFLSVYFQRYDGMVKFYKALPDVMYVRSTSPSEKNVDRVFRMIAARYGPRIAW